MLFIARCFSQVNGDSQPTVVLFLRTYLLSSGSRTVEGRARQHAVPFQEKWKSQSSANSDRIDSLCCDLTEAYSNIKRVKLAVHQCTPHLAASHVS